MKYYIQTLGCAMNYSDSERVAALLEKLGYKSSSTPEETDLYIFNTCSIRKKGEDRVYGQLQNLEQLKKSNPRLLVGLTGCMVRSTSSRNSSKELKDEIIKKNDLVDFVFRIIETNKIGEILMEAEPQLDIPQLEEAQLNDYLKIKPKYNARFMAFVPIQIGCDKYCTYCIVPYSRGREKSRPMNDILAECHNLVENGCKEITLVGQTVNSYSLSQYDKQGNLFNGLANPFVHLLKELDKLKKNGLNRIRFTSPHPKDYTDELINAHCELETLCPHFHLPVQSGSDAVLKRMNRKYTIEEYTNIVRKIRQRFPACSITTDIIVGFCGETEEQFEETLRLFEEIRWDMAYIARYSPRPGTVSFKAFNDDVPTSIKAARWHKLNNLLEKCCLEKNKAFVGRTLEVLVEKYNCSTREYEGRSRENKLVQFQELQTQGLQTSEALGLAGSQGEIVNVQVTKALKWLLKGQIAAQSTMSGFANKRSLGSRGFPTEGSRRERGRRACAVMGEKLGFPPDSKTVLNYLA